MSVTIIVRLTEREADAVLRSELRESYGGWATRQTVAQKTAQMKIIGAVAAERSADS